MTGQRMTAQERKVAGSMFRRTEEVADLREAEEVEPRTHTEKTIDTTEHALRVIETLSRIATDANAYEVTSDRDKVKLDVLGSWVAGRLAGLKVIPAADPTKDKDQHIAYIDTPDGRQLRFNMPTDLQKKIFGDMVNEFIMAVNVGTLDTGHKTGTPMTVYKVWRFGNKLPATVAALFSSDDLPF
jgi:hypothetical protein